MLPLSKHRLLYALLNTSITQDLNICSQGLQFLNWKKHKERIPKENITHLSRCFHGLPKHIQRKSLSLQLPNSLELALNRLTSSWIYFHVLPPWTKADKHPTDAEINLGMPSIHQSTALLLLLLWGLRDADGKRSSVATHLMFSIIKLKNLTLLHKYNHWVFLHHTKAKNGAGVGH